MESLYSAGKKIQERIVPSLLSGVPVFGEPCIQDKNPGMSNPEFAWHDNKPWSDPFFSLKSRVLQDIKTQPDIACWLTWES